MKVRFVTCHNHKFGTSSNICNIASAKVILLPKSCWFNSWTINSLYGWKFKAWCKIRRTVVSDNLRAWAWCTADQRGLWSTAFRKASKFSGVLTVRLDTMFLRCRSRGTDVVLPKKYHVSWRDPHVTRNIKMQTKHPLCVDYRFAVSKSVSTTNARWWGLHCSMSTKTAKPFASNGTRPMATVHSAFIH